MNVLATVIQKSAIALLLITLQNAYLFSKLSPSYWAIYLQ